MALDIGRDGENKSTGNEEGDNNLCPWDTAVFAAMQHHKAAENASMTQTN